MSRRWFVVVVVILVAQVVGIPIYGNTFAGSVLANLVQITSSALAGAVCLVAYRQAKGVCRWFWGLVALGFVTWTAASVGWMYTEDWRKAEIPGSSLLHFAYQTPIAFFVMAALLDEERDAERLSVQTLLDFTQVGIIIFFLYFDFYYIPAFHMKAGESLMRENLVGAAENSVSLFLALARFRLARSEQLRRLYGGMVVFLASFLACIVTADIGQIKLGTATGTWYDLGWTVPFLVAIVLATSWKPGEAEPTVARRKTTWVSLAATNLMLAFVPLFIVVRGLQVPAQWRLIGLLTLILSGACYAARLVLYQYQQTRTAEALQENVGLLQAVSDGTSEAIFVKDLAGRYLMINGAWARVLGKPVEDALGKDDTELFPAETARAIQETDRQAIASGRMQTYEEAHTIGSDRRVYLSSKGPYRDHAGKVLGLIGISVDITEHRRAEDYFRSLVQNSSDMISILDADGTIRYVSPAIERMLGYRPAEMVGKNAFEYAHPEDLPRMRSLQTGGLRDDGASASLEFRCRNAKGNWASLWAVTTNLLNDPSVRGIVVNTRDVTEQKRLEKARLEAEARYRALVEQLIAVTYIARLGLEGEWLYVSPQISSMLGYTPEEWLADSKMWINRIHPDDRGRVASAEHAAITGRPFRAEYRILHKDGRVVWVDDTASVMRDGEGNNVLHGVLLDVTERRRLESELHQAQKMQAVGKLAGGIAHDFNNMLTVILGYAQNLLDQPHPSRDQVRHGSEQIVNAADRAASLTQQLLAFSRKQVLEPRALNLNNVIAEMDKMLRRLITEDIHIVTLPALQLGTVKADPTKMEQVILNLVINARDAMPDGGQLTLETANVELDQSYADEHNTVLPGRYVMLAVSDTGQGMDAETQARVFEPFFTTKKMGKGTGLGLATVYGIVKQSGGHIWVYSEPGRGTTFKVYLPRVEAPVDAANREVREVSSLRGTENILLVEDDQMVRNLTSTVLRSCGYTVLAPEQIEDVETLCRQYPGTIHLLLTDVIMPGMSGRELARHVTALRPEMKVIYMSGYTANAVAKHGLLEPGITLVQKPFTPGVLARKIRETLDQPVKTH